MSSDSSIQPVLQNLFDESDSRLEAGSYRTSWSPPRNMLQNREQESFGPESMKELEVDNAASPVLWKQGNEDDESSSPVLFGGHPPQRQKEDLYKLYEQLTGPFQELTFSDFVGQTESAVLPSVDAPAKPPHKKSTSTVSPSRRSLREELRSPRTGSFSPAPMSPAPKSPSHPRSPYSPFNHRSPSPRDGSRVNHSSFDASCHSPMHKREHSLECHTCKTKTMIFKTRCLVCGKLYCRSCVKEAMGSMLEGRKCKACLGQRFSHRYISRAGKGWWLSSRVKQVELRWAKKKPKDGHISARSFQISMRSPSVEISG